ncbi:hypothetical protein [Actinophytocola sp. NPDC049390]|uniref:hypothetical protein n=1 Tax=Actinophytocola sp. NPDC049390 TaxID=3363894 RepID=UPI003797A9CB
MDDLGPGTVRVAEREVVVAGSAEEYAELARAVDPGSSPLPVPAEVWSRCVASLATLPAAAGTAAHWRGTVLVADDRFAAVGDVLARGSGRPVRHGDLADAVALSGTGPVTVVAGIESVTPERLAAIPADAPLGFLVGRTVGDAAALAVRTLLHGPAVADALGDLSFDTLAEEDTVPGRLIGEDVTPAGLRAAIGDGVAVLAGSGHGRDCIMHLDGGGICGRVDDQPVLELLPPTSDGWTDHPTSCQQGEGCWRGDFDMAGHVRAAELRVAVAVLDSCRTAVAGGGAIRPDVSVPLTTLRGSAIAVLSAAGTRSGADYAGRLCQALIRSGLPLGAVAQEVNKAIAADPEGLGRLVLFGDAGLVAAPAGPLPVRRPDADGGVTVAEGAGAVLVSGPPLLPVDRDGPLAVDRGDGGSWVLTTAVDRRGGRLVPAPAAFDDAWDERVRPWLTRLRALPGMGITPDEDRLDAVHRKAVAALRARAAATHATAAQAAADAFAAQVDELADLQRGLVEHEVAWVAKSFYAFIDSWPEPWRVTSDPLPETCPQCGIAGAVRHRVRSAGGAGPDLCYVVCLRCGEMLAGAAEPGAEVAVRAPAEARRGEPFTVAVTVTAPADRAVDVAVGAAVVNESMFGITLADTTALRLTAGERRVVELNAETGTRTFPDLQPVKILVVVDGAVRCLTRSVWLRVQES